ncbi:MAG: alpha/beta hydrolase [Rhodococcus sp. (in: high G+C Gram-positive bacteria)]|jgi:pimeloyl-ACP methyl ester carboxylesterase|uniref:alpha/beta fold hydrolase n=1 Tax=Rhodococcus sp. EPR-157 TaxID=1813677 RepID=UPI0007BBCA16|nr:alpha/beta hydrolase [Rhodococcus sp. EPR-157]KZF02142.1 haloalkane dehalogenase [Rhodococcus sp. EPR-157]
MTATATTVTVDDLVFDVSVDGPDNGVPVVLLHGFPQTSACWDRVVPRLTAAGVRTIAPDQRGYSPGARPIGTDAYRSSHLVDDVLAIIEAFDLESAHVVGHDWGAAVAWQLAATHPEQVRSLTAVSIPHTAAFGWAIREDADQQQRSSYIGLLRQEGKAEQLLLENDAQRLRAMFSDDSPDDRYVKHLAEPGALTAALEWYRAMTSEFGRLGPVKVPTTYVWSNQDSAVGRAGAERCGEFVDAEYKFVELDGVSHWVPEEAPDRLATEILARIRDLSVGSVRPCPET